jgi:hypothetical protein
MATRHRLEIALRYSQKKGDIKLVSLALGIKKKDKRLRTFEPFEI